MCGIAGIISPQKDKAPKEIIKLMTDKIIHRGPDDSDVWTNSEQSIGLGHRRLSILDLSSRGRQPMWDSSGKYCIIFNGEIYNFQELRTSLQEDGFSFHSHTDTEVILNLYAKLGEECVKLMNGMWAFAIYDKEKDLIFCSRDRFGKKPFYYALTKDAFIFASQPKALRVVPEINWDLNEEGIGHYLTYGYIPEPHTAWKHIHKLPHGYNLTVSVKDPNNIKLSSYWQSKDLLQPNYNETEEEISSQIQEHLEKAVERRLIADVPVGAFLSGGIDSSAVVAAMTKKVESSHQIHTFSVGFDHTKYSETQFAEIVAKKLHTNHHTKTLNSEEAWNIFQKLPEFYDEPFADSSMIPTYAVSQLAREYVTVALSGDGADELWGGYLNYVMYKYLLTLKKVIPPALHGLAGIGANILAQSLRPARSNPGLALGLKGISWLSNPSSEIFAHLSSLYVDINPKYFRLFDQYFSSNTWEDNLMQTYLNTHLVDDFLVKVDRASMAHGLEVRSPFLDSDFVRYSLTVPATHKIHVQGFRYHLKGALRKSLKGILPSSILERGKQGFSLPMSEYLVDEWSSFAHEHIRAISDKNIIPLSKKDITHIMKQHEKGVTDYSQFIYALMSLNNWHEYWKNV